MTIKHTPGPWAASYDEVRAVRNRRVVANAFATHPDEREANARLIAAAPQLLDALKGLLEIGAPEGLAMTADEMQSRYAAARAAIIAAEG